MSAGEIGFLPLGLVLGILLGGSIVVLLRSRVSTREVRVTVTPDSIPRRRATTLAEDAFFPAAEAARGGPADPAEIGRPVPAPTVAASARPRPLVGISIQPEPDEQLAALRGLAVAAARRREPSVLRVDGPPPSITGGPAVDPGLPRASTNGSAGINPVLPDPDPPSTGELDECAGLRRIADERCALAGRARAQAVATHEALRAAQRAYDEHQSRAERAGETADPRSIRAAKDAAQQAFRAARAAATAPDAIEAAARDWLSEINRINRLSREAATTAAGEREAAAAMVSTIERLTLEADAARISAETADSACQAARQAAADCGKAGAARRRGEVAVPSPSAEETATAGAGSRALSEAADPAILRMLRGDRAALGMVVSALAGPHPEDVRHWRLLLSTLVDEILARAIEAGALVYPTEHPFWGPFTRTQNRDITTALGSLGFRFDGLGGWVDDRTPSQRDLSLAVGYAGLDPMRVRHWPNEAEMGDLYRHVTVAGDEFLLESAGDLTLGELVTLLGPRADELAGLWNEWARVRPLLLSD